MGPPLFDAHIQTAMSRRELRWDWFARLIINQWCLSA